ncbi:Rossmann-fold NAD(P)-binding domain-containing protein [Sphingobacterium paludis]|uniref:D-lactate dehydrogenase n=1 Tax=Sphingobacterium paludis TaxID=1476465 RepID=A0A4R7D7U9_9SPHI|nr:lactate dehydrogenase [Sphingobacterium paludis]TDS16291.1 D-lactate dehydrogenase [Sphingobacterium paludis]
MKAVAYNIKDFEKELLARANGKVHDLTLISNALNYNTLHYASGKEVVIVSADDRLNADILDQLKEVGIQKIVTRSLNTDHIDLYRAADLNIQVANTPYPDRTAKGIAEQTIRNLNLWDSGRCVGTACCCVKDCSITPFNTPSDENHTR